MKTKALTRLKAGCWSFYICLASCGVRPSGLPPPFRAASPVYQSWGMRAYQRRLPHWDTVRQALFVTFRLHGSLPASHLFPPERLRNARAFAVMDKLLDCNRAGPVFLSLPEIANWMVRALLDGVHLLVTPQGTARQWLGPLKDFTGHGANRSLSPSGAF